MIPRSFDTATAREYVGDERRRTLEDSARAGAEVGVYAPPNIAATTYAGAVASQMADIVYQHAYAKRLARIQRMAQPKEN